MTLIVIITLTSIVFNLYQRKLLQISRKNEKEAKEFWTQEVQKRRKITTELTSRLIAKENRKKWIDNENQKLKECVEFYANDSHWHHLGDERYITIKPDDIEKDYFVSEQDCGGKRARQCLAELNKE